MKGRVEPGGADEWEGKDENGPANGKEKQSKVWGGWEQKREDDLRYCGLGINS